MKPKERSNDSIESKKVLRSITAGYLLSLGLMFFLLSRRVSSVPFSITFLLNRNHLYIQGAKWIPNISYSCSEPNIPLSLNLDVNFARSMFGSRSPSRWKKIFLIDSASPGENDDSARRGSHGSRGFEKRLPMSEKKSRILDPRPLLLS